MDRERRQFVQNGLLVLGGLMCGLVSAGNAFAAEPINFDTLRMSLCPKTEGEKKYLKEVVELVQKKQIPEKIVHAAWRSAENKQKVKRMRSFAETLGILCKRTGVKRTIKLNP